jgi:hypothetical protein
MVDGTQEPKIEQTKQSKRKDKRTSPSPQLIIATTCPFLTLDKITSEPYMVTTNSFSTASAPTSPSGGGGTSKATCVCEDKKEERGR